jgi:3-methyladenine DNA glycosylase AlkC
MAEPFKHLINAPLVRRMATHLQRTTPRFDAAAFVAAATAGLDALELKARAMQVADALEAGLPDDFDEAARSIVSALAPPWPDDRLGSDDPGRDGLEGWALWPVGEVVARRGTAQPQRALATLHALTQRFSAEFAIRPIIAAHPVLAFETLQRWTRDDSAHVRRLVSEGSRPRLPWGQRLQALVADPSPTLPLLRALQDDRSEYVRRSVANHLNDIAKDHPALVADWLAEHLPGASPQRTALLRHASRTLIKQGDRRVLAAWGLGQRLRGSAMLAVAPAAVALGDSLDLTVTLVSSSAKPQRLAVDYAVHHVKADGSVRPKVFKGWVVTLPARGTLALARRHSMKPVTTRRYHPGAHAIDLQVNGEVVASAGFTLAVP